MGDDLDELAATAATTKRPGVARRVDRKVPRYRALEAVGSFLVTLGAIGVIIGGAVMAFGFYRFGSNGEAGFPIIVGGVSVTVAAFTWYVAGEAISAFRDMAINSWYARRD